MMHKTWNVRDQTEKDLRVEVERLYKEIEAGYKMLKKVSEINDAKKILDRIWIMKAWANDIQLELIRREYTKDEAQAANAEANRQKNVQCDGTQNKNNQPVAETHAGRHQTVKEKKMNHNYYGIYDSVAKCYCYIGENKSDETFALS